MTPFQSWVASLVTLVLGVACQVLAVVFPAVSIPLLAGGTVLLAKSSPGTILAGPSGPTPPK